MEGLVIMPFGNIYQGARVLITGHTGFKGAWLAEWLLGMGAEVTGLALAPPPEAPLFNQLCLAARLRHVVGDIRDLATVQRVLDEVRPEFLFHLAAQPLVRLSFEQPVDTFATNVLGTIHVLEALRLAPHVCTAVMVTTDKCYENREWVHSYREEDPLGGFDPYSCSKAAAELTISAYRKSYFSGPTSAINVASARAGNVIGGGDWAQDRIVPDCIRAWRTGRPISVRNPRSRRPWQHVLEPLSGYLRLAACIHDTVTCASTGSRNELCAGFNFGPRVSSNRTVLDLVEAGLRHWPGRWEDKTDPHAVHEARLLHLSIDKSYHLLGWQPVWDFDETVAKTFAWYREDDASRDSATIAETTRAQIATYVADARQCGVAWAR